MTGDLKPRVMHVITHLELGGAEGVAMQLLEGLAPDVDGAIFSVIESSSASAIGLDRTRRADALGAPIFFGTRRGFKSGGVVQAAWRLARVVDSFRPDILHVHTEIPELTLAVASAMSRKVAKTPLLRTVHNSVLWIDWARLGSLVTRRLAHGRAVAVSQSAADADQALITGKGRPRANVIYNAATPSTVLAPASDRRPVRVLFAARLVHQKGADWLPAILAGAQKLARRRDVDVVIAGEGAFEADLARAFAQQQGDDGWRIRLVKPIDNLAQKLADYDIMLSPSRFEGLSLLHLEALMAGMPMLAFRAPGLNELLPSDYALAADVGDIAALSALLAGVVDDVAHHKQVAAAYRPYVMERFAPARMLAAYLAQYRGLIGGEVAQ